MRSILNGITLGLATGLAAALAIAGCSAWSTAKPGLSIGALEAACAETAATLASSRDCRNAVRRAWASANGLAVKDLDGGTDVAD